MTPAAGPVGRVLRDLMLPTIPKHVAAGSPAWMHDYLTDRDEKVVA